MCSGSNRHVSEIQASHVNLAEAPEVSFALANLISYSLPMGWIGRWGLLSICLLCNTICSSSYCSGGLPDGAPEPLFALTLQIS